MTKATITREKAVRKILESGGKMFTVTWIKKNGNVRKLNGKFIQPSVKRQNQDKIFGYLTLYDPHKKNLRRVDSRKITALSISKQVFTVR